MLDWRKVNAYHTHTGTHARTHGGYLRVFNVSSDLQPESSNSLEMIVDAFAEAHKCYGKEK